VKVSIIRDVKTPTRGTSGSAGIDFYVPNSLKGIGVSGNSQLHLTEMFSFQAGSRFKFLKDGLSLPSTSQEWL
jgi:hypothetical protein